MFDFAESTTTVKWWDIVHVPPELDDEGNSNSVECCSTSFFSTDDYVEKIDKSGLLEELN